MRFLFLFFIFTFNVFAMSVKIVATVNEVAITNFDVKTRVELTKLLKADVFKNANIEEINGFILEALIKEQLFIKKSRDFGFTISNEELETEVMNISHNIPFFKGKNPKTILSVAMYNSFKNQIFAEIISSSLIQSKVKDSVNFTDEEIERVQKSYLEFEKKQISKDEAKNILFSIKLNEAEQNLLSGLLEEAVIERK